MARRKRSTAEPRKETGRRQPLGRRPAVWLATLSTVVGLATGMFTLRDQVFPRESGTAVAVPVSVYEARVGDVCDQLNDNDRRRVREQKATRTRLRRATTTESQRNSLLDGVRRTVARSADALAAFSAIDAPKALAAARGETVAAWSRNVARVRGYALRLDRAGTRDELLAALDHLSTLRPRIARDGDRIVSGLRRLGAASCDLRPPVVTPAFSLPPLRGEGGGTPDAGSPDPGSGDSGSPEGAPQSSGATGDASSESTAGGDRSTGSVTTPDSVHQGGDVSVTTPEPDSPTVAPTEGFGTSSPDTTAPGTSSPDASSPVPGAGDESGGG